MLKLKNLKENDYGEMEGDFFCSCLQKEVEIVYEKNLPFDVVTKSIDHLYNIYSDLLPKLCKYTKDYCMDFMQNYPDVDYQKGLYQLKDVLDILNYVYLDLIRIESHNNSIVLNISGGCEWAEELCLQWIIEDNNIEYVGPWNDLRISSPGLRTSIFNYCTR